MKLSTKARYGLRAMLCLALMDRDRWIMTKEIAEMQKLPLTYLEQLMMSLRKGGLVTAMRGAHGGYMLARDPAQITLAQIVEALEGPLQIADCADVPNCCVEAAECALKEIFEDVNNALYGAFDAITLADFAEKQRGKEGAHTSMFFI
jgi:Rrf2 family protein